MCADDQASDSDILLEKGARLLPIVSFCVPKESDPVLLRGEPVADEIPFESGDALSRSSSAGNPTWRESVRDGFASQSDPVARPRFVRVILAASSV